MQRLVLTIIVLLAWPSFAKAALVERLMGLPGFGDKIAVHMFFASNHQRIDGELTRQDVIDAFQMSAADIVEYDALAALAPTGTAALNVAQKAMFIEKIHAIFILAEDRFPGYTTAALVRAKLGLP